METMGDSTPAAQRSFAGEFALFFVCLFIAVIIWLFTALSENYEQEINVGLSYVLPESQTTTIPLPQEAHLLVSSSGWQLVKEGFRHRAMSLDVSDLDDKPVLLTNNHLGLFTAGLPGNMHIVQVIPDTIDLHLEPLAERKVPIVLNADFMDRTDIVVDSIYIHPDSITIRGPKSLITDITYWSTEAIAGNGDSIIDGITPLPFPAVGSIRLSAILADWHAEIEAAIEANAYLTINTPTNHAVDVRIQYSSAAEVSSLIGAKDFNITFEKTADGTQYHIVARAKRRGLHTIGVYPAFIPITM